MAHASTPFNQQTELGHQLAPRDEDCDHDFVAVQSPVSAIVDQDASVSSTESEESVRIPISYAYHPLTMESYPLISSCRTQTAYETFYSISKVVKSTALTSTSTEHVAVPPSNTGEADCGVAVETETNTSVVTVTRFPASSSSPGYATVTGNPSTLTHVNTDTSYAGGFPDVTVSGNPSTRTNVQTDVSCTGLPGVNFSGNPSTVTDVHTDLSLTGVLSDVTISGSPSITTEVGVSYSLVTSVISSPGRSLVTVVITDLWGTLTRSTVTETVTATRTSAATTITTPVVTTVSDLYPIPSVGDETSTSEDSYTSAAKGGGFPGSGTMEPLYPTNGTVVVNPPGTVTAVPGPTTPVIISGSVKPEPHGWGIGNGSNHLGYTMMLIAIIMCML